MAANTTPIFPLTPRINFVTIDTEDTSTTVPTTEGQIVFTAGAEGARIDGMVIKAQGTNIATVLRIFINDGAGVVAANFSLVAEYTLDATTASAVAALENIVLKPIDLGLLGDSDSYILPPFLPATYKIYVAIGTTIATGVSITCVGADY